MRWTGAASPNTSGPIWREAQVRGFNRVASALLGLVLIVGGLLVALEAGLVGRAGGRPGCRWPVGTARWSTPRSRTTRCSTWRSGWPCSAWPSCSSSCGRGRRTGSSLVHPRRPPTARIRPTHACAGGARRAHRRSRPGRGRQSPAGPQPDRRERRRAVVGVAALGAAPHRQRRLHRLWCERWARRHPWPADCACGSRVDGPAHRYDAVSRACAASSTRLNAPAGVPVDLSLRTPRRRVV